MSLLVQILQKTVRKCVKLELELGYRYFQTENEVLGPVSE